MEQQRGTTKTGGQVLHDLRLRFTVLSVEQREGRVVTLAPAHKQEGGLWREGTPAAGAMVLVNIDPGIRIVPGDEYTFTISQGVNDLIR